MQTSSGDQVVVRDPEHSMCLDIFQRLVAHAPMIARTSARQRIQKLNKLMEVILREQDALREALYADFGKPSVETDLSEVLQVASEIRHFRRHLPHWMDGRQVSTPLSLIGHKSHIEIQPKGVVLILSPWNFPINLTFMPLVAAVAAGNAVVLKPSEYTPHAATVMSRVVSEVFSENEVVLVEGGVSVATALLDLPFNHIHFTGSPAVGRIVMAKAARHLASVTLELGGKSPAIIDKNADIKKAANRIMWGKCFNAGQICIAPDYVLVHRTCMDAFVEEAGKVITEFYGISPQTSPDYARLIHKGHYQRLMTSIQTALQQGAKCPVGGEGHEETRYLAPTILTEIPEDHALLHEEIFGPILPVVPFDDLEEALQFVNQRPKPLALYIFSKSRKVQRDILRNTRAGGTGINTTLVHFYNNHLPFGGDNNSGIGKAHGYYSFIAFSNERGVIREAIPWTAADLVKPPYGSFVRWLAKVFTRWI